MPPESGPPSSRDRWYEKAPDAPAERFPLLADMLAGVAKAWTDGFNTLSASPGELTFEGLSVQSAGELLAGAGAAPVMAALRAPACGGMVGLLLDHAVVSTVVDALFGGGDEEDDSAEARPLSPVELRIVDVIGGQAATALTAGLAQGRFGRIEFDRALAKPDAGFLGKPATALLRADFAMRALGRSVSLALVLPLRMLEERQAALGGAPTTAPDMDDTSWSRLLQAELARACMMLRASIGAGEFSLKALAGWRVGQVIELPPGAGNAVLLSCEDEMLFRCDLGQSKGRYTLRIEEPLRDGDHPHASGRN